MTGRLATVSAALGALLACTDATPPERVEAYRFTIDCSEPDVCSSEADSTLRLIFRWSETSLPVRVWVQPTGDLPVVARAALDAWEAASLYGEFRAVLTADSSRADVIIVVAGGGSVAGGGEVAPLDCRGQTNIEIGLDTAIVLPFRTVLSPRLGATPSAVLSCYRAVTLHELGHAFGLLLHSDRATDVMHVRPTATELTERDIATFSALYHTPPTVRIPADR